MFHMIVQIFFFQKIVAEITRYASSCYRINLIIHFVKYTVTLVILMKYLIRFVLGLIIVIYINRILHGLSDKKIILNPTLEQNKHFILY